ncbi:hypothetical protein EDC04DRAFT_2752187 [Pisolithus marmoratus]|nr:hypothetical protein EDC04DRAFT_2752187 [Pisolithus marmoratus]
MPDAVVVQPQHAPKTSHLKSVLGFGALTLKDAAPIRGRFSADTATRVSIDCTTPTSFYPRHTSSRIERASVTNLAAFFKESRSNSHRHAPELSDTTNTSVRSMNSLDAAPPRAIRRQPVRIDAQDGPWAVSVAETPHDARSYSIYIKSASTHNLTLTRTATEIVELHAKLADSDGSAKLPKLPIDVSTLPPPPKRKSTFLNTLSRLASPSSNKVGRHASLRIPSNPNFGSFPGGSQTPLVSPSQEVGDPFTPLGETVNTRTSSNGNNPPPVVAASTPADKNTMMTSLAAYLTTIANEPTLRQTRAWKRFVRVRTDDLESTRAERAIKRVRSDLAAHVGTGKHPNPEGSLAHASSRTVSSSNESEVVDGIESVDGTVDGEPRMNDGSKSTIQEGIKEEEEDNDALVESPLGVDTEEAALEGTTSTQPADTEIPDEEPDPSPVDKPVPSVDTDAVSRANDEEATTLPTPIADGPMSRPPRSHSADPSCGPRRHTTSVTQTDGMSSATTGDESSISTTAGRRERKKRSQSTDPSRKKKTQRKVMINDFEMMRVLGKGCAGKVLLVRHKDSSDLYALKAITKRHVLAHQELQHTLTEQAVLKRMAKEGKDPFVVKLWWSFHDKENLFLVMDFHPGGDLATQLARWGRLGRDRARFYAAEIVEGVEGLHAAGVIYRDLKPENILIGADGHIVLTDFGLSKEFPRRASSITAPPTPSGTRGEFYEAASSPWMKGDRDLAMGWPGQSIGPADTTSTFCGTAEYLAPEVIQGLPYSYEVDWWSFGTMLYEMLTGITPYWANNHSDMYVRVLQDELQFPEDRAMDQDTKSLIRGLLQRNPALRMCEPRIKRHPYFSMIDWGHVYYKRYIPPYIPPIDPSNASDTQNFDDTFLDMEPILDDPNEPAQTDTDQDRDQTDSERTDGEDAYPTPSHSRSPSVHPNGDADIVDVFDGYSFKGRISMLIDEDAADEDVSDVSGEVETDEDLPSVTGVVDVSAGQAGEISESPVGIEEKTPEPEPEPKTPEARPQLLQPESQPSVVPPDEKLVPVAHVPSSEGPATPRTSKETPIIAIPASPKEPAPPLPAKDGKTKSARIVAPATKSNIRTTRGRREKSGIPALDRFLSDGPDEDGESTEKDDEDEDWDFIEAGDGEDRNGTKGANLFARGVVDRYKLAVFRKASTPSQRPAGRSFSGLSKESDLHAADAGDSPSPSDKHRRGRAPGLKFRRTPKQFLTGKSPSSSVPSKNGSSSKTPTNSTTNTATLSSMSSNGLLTPSASTMPVPPSLKSKESAVSVGDQSVSSDQSNGDAPSDLFGSPEVVKVTSPQSPGHSEEPGPEKHKTKKLKKYKENAEKVLSLFASPR